MLTEVSPTYWMVKVNGKVVASNLPTKMVAESTVLQLPPDQRPLAEIVPVTADGKTVLFG